MKSTFFRKFPAFVGQLVEAGTNVSFGQSDPTRLFKLTGSPICRMRFDRAPDGPEPPPLDPPASGGNPRTRPS